MTDSSGGEHAVKRSADVNAETLKGARDTRIQILVGPDDGAPNFVMRRILMDEVGSGMPAHTNAVEHEQYVLRGRARIGIAGEEYEVTADDTVFIPAGAPHWYDVVEAPFEFLCVVPNAPDEVRLVDKEDRD
ncbi:MAG: cupin domain-containing protein [Acidobacteriota bacterium]|jgi:quercetin dioxygenase-like cupin family protein